MIEIEIKVKIASSHFDLLIPLNQQAKKVFAILIG